MKTNYCIIIFAFLLSIQLSSCNGGNSDKQQSDSIVTDSFIPPKLNPTGELAFLKDYIGKYPHEVNLLDNHILAKRMKALLGDERFKFVSGTWAVSTPMELTDEYFVAEGCEAHNCASTNFIIVVDLNKDILYVGIREEEVVKKYAENGNTLPEEMEVW